MLKEHRDLVRKTHLFLDALCILLAWGAAYLLFAKSGHKIENIQHYFFPVSLFTFVVLFYLSARRVQPEAHLGHSFAIFFELGKAAFFGMLSVAVSLYFFEIHYLSRTYLAGGSVASLLFLWAWNFLAFSFYREIRKKGMNYQQTLLIGNAYTLPPVIQVIEKNPALGQRVAAILLMETEGDLKSGDFAGSEVYRGADKINEILNTHVIDNALFTTYRQDPGAVEKAMLACQERGINVWFKPDFIHGNLVSSVDYLSDMPLFVFALGPKYSNALALKRLFDIVASAILLVIMALPMLVIALLIKTTPGDAFFLQKRVGLNGRHFLMAKFRTMTKDAEQRRAEYNLKNEMQGPVFKIKDDPRITPVGRFLRRYSLDEVPQFWNVLNGDMSLVGPRPPLPSEVDLYQGWQRRRLSMRPGITCLWQVSGRNKITNFNEWVRLDLQYIDKWSLWLDLKILLMTIPAVLKGTGV